MRNRSRGSSWLAYFKRVKFLKVKAFARKGDVASQTQTGGTAGAGPRGGGRAAQHTARRTDANDSQ